MSFASGRLPARGRPRLPGCDQRTRHSLLSPTSGHPHRSAQPLAGL